MPIFSRRHIVGGVALAALAFGSTTGSFAQAYPNKPIRIVVPAAVGGSVDAMSRQLAPYWEKTLGVPIVVDNKPGAGGITGVRYFLEQPADGYTIMVSTLDHYSATIEKTRTVKSTDVDLINLQQFAPTTWFVLDGSRFRSLDDVISEAKAKPNTISYGTPPTANTLLSASILKEDWGVNLRYVPQESGAQTDTAVLGGHIDIKVGTAGDVDEVTGVRALAVAGDQRVPFLPNAPTFNEVGAKLGLGKVPNLGAGRLLAVSANVKSQYPDRYRKLMESYKAAFNDPGYRKVLESSGQAKSTTFNEPDAATSAFRQLIDDTIALQAKSAARR